MASMIAQEYDYQYQEDEHLFTENAYEAAVAIPAKKILTEERVAVLPKGWIVAADEITKEKYFYNLLTKEKLSSLEAYPLATSLYFPGITMYDEAKEEYFSSTRRSIDFDNGLQIDAHPSAVAARCRQSITVQVCFAPDDIHVLPKGITSVSPAYLVSKTGKNSTGVLTVSISHHVKVTTTEDSRKLTILYADSTPSTNDESKPVYQFKEIPSERVVFAPGRHEGRTTMSLKSLSVGKFLKAGWKKLKKKLKSTGKKTKPASRGEKGACGSIPNLYTMRVYKSSLQSVEERIAVFCLCLQHPVYSKFLQQLDTELIPRDYPQIPSSRSQRIIREPLEFLDKKARLEFVPVDGWTVDIDQCTIYKRGVDLIDHYQPEDLHNYPPRIVCRFYPQIPATPLGVRTSCRFSLTDMDEEVKVNIPLRKEVDTLAESEHSQVQKEYHDLDIENVDSTTRLEEDDVADITRELDELKGYYYELGIRLHLSPGKMKEIQVDHPYNCLAAFMEVFVQWICMNYDNRKFGPPSWRKLVEAVNMFDHDKAKLLASKHQRKLILEIHENQWPQQGTFVGPLKRNIMH